MSLVQTRSEKGRTGSQTIYQSTFTTVLIAFKDPTPVKEADAFQVLLPVGPFTRCEVTAACTRPMG